jgi:hypothetical protein
MAHIDERVADRTIAEGLDLGPLGALAIGAIVGWDFRHRSELIGDAAERWVLPVLDLQPVIARACAAGALAVLRDQTLKTHAAGGAERDGSDLSLLEWSDEDAIRPAAQQLLQVGLAQMQGQAGEVVAVIRQTVESV